MDKIRLGLVRCSDIHGYYYGVMLADFDPIVLLEKYYIVHYYASNIYDPRKITIPKVDGSDHLKLATPFLKKSIPTFIYKPFSSNLKDAREIINLAEKHKTPIFNASILSYVPSAQFFKQRFKEIDHTYYPVPDEKPDIPIGLGVIKGVGGTFSQELAGKGVSGGLEERMAYLIHGVSLALNLFGLDVEWLEVMGESSLEYMHLRMKNGMNLIIINTSTKVFPEACNFYASVYSKYGAVHSEPIGDPQFIGGAENILKLFRDMVITGKSPVPYENFIKHIAVIEAGVLAQQKGIRVYLKDV